MTQSKMQLSNPGNSSQILATAVAGILSLFPDTAPIAVLGSIGVLCWQNEQANKFKQIFQARLNSIQDQLDQLLDLNFMDSPEFLELVLRATEAASRTASEQKHKALANALLASTISPTSNFNGKTTIMRIIDQMSEEEMTALRELSIIEDSQINEDGVPGTLLSVIKAQLGWTEEDLIAAYEGLLQLGLTRDRSGVLFDEEVQSRQRWETSALAKRVVQFVTQAVTV
jgi:hypothetical protein